MSSGQWWPLCHLLLTVISALNYRCSSLPITTSSAIWIWRPLKQWDTARETLYYQDNPLFRLVLTTLCHNHTCAQQMLRPLLVTDGQWSNLMLHCSLFLNLFWVREGRNILIYQLTSDDTRLRHYLSPDADWCCCNRNQARACNITDSQLTSQIRLGCKLYTANLTTTPDDIQTQI